MSSSRHTNIHFVKTEIGKSSPSKVRIDVDRSSYVLGTNADSAMKFGGQYVSRKHATIDIVNGTVSLVDQSRVGTWVNGVPLVKNQPFPLMVGDRINLGSEHTVLMVGGEGGTLGGLLMRDPKPELKLDIDGRAVLKNGFKIGLPLTPTEFDVLSEMYQHRGQVITFERIWAIMHHHQPSVSFKARVAQEAVKGEKTVLQLAALYGVDQSLVEAWKKELIKEDAGVLNGDQDNGDVYEGKPVDRFESPLVGDRRIHQSISELRKKIERPDSKPVIVLTAMLSQFPIRAPEAGYKMPKFLGD